ncbi:MAG: choice-of-anchor D domain-containing protein [Deltaproteobacteria bacterium]|nr:choice-of-anchor D domain-containing protein [Deltaproteobacteria bacterium]
MSSIRVLGLVALLGLLAMLCCLPACGDSTVSASDTLDLCALDSDCPPGAFCDDGVCRPGSGSCDASHPCPDGMVCRNGTCAPAGVPDGGTDGGADGEADGGDQAPGGPDIEVLAPPMSDGIYQLHFGNVMVGVTVEQQIRISNAGDEDLQILELSFEAVDAQDFSIPSELLDSLPRTVPPGEELGIDVVYRASDGITDHGILDIISNDPDEALVKVHLLSEFKGEARVQLSAQSLDFGDVPCGELSQPLSFSAANQGSGNAVLTVELIRFGLLANPDFDFEVLDTEGAPVALPALLNNGDALDVQVVYFPQDPGPDIDRVIVVCDDPLDPHPEVAISGRGVVGEIAIDPSPVDLGRVRVGQHAEREILITNSGGAGVFLERVDVEDLGPAWTLSSDDLDLAGLESAPFFLAPGDGARVLLGFDPVDIGIQAGRLVVEHSGPAARIDAAVSAVGYIPPALETEPDPAALDFGSVQFDAIAGLSESAELPLVLRNTGGEPLVVTGIQLEAPSSEISWRPQTVSPIAPAEQAVLDVRFEPDPAGSPGPRSARLLLDTNDPDLELAGTPGRLAVDLSARAVDPAIVVTPLQHDFGDVTIGDAASLLVTIISASNDPLRIHEIRKGSGSSGDFSLADLPDLGSPLVGAGSQVSFRVIYAPGAIGDDEGTVEIASADLGRPLVMVDLVGTSSGCPAGWSDCDPGVEGCETHIAVDIDHCGGCAIACTNEHGSTSCIDGRCTPDCDPLFGSCDGDPTNGCETALDSLTHCGACYDPCDLPHASETCETGSCEIDVCEDGYTDCNAFAPGCETHTDSDLLNCGQCNLQCINEHGSTECYQGVCRPSCETLWGDCDANPANGCERSLDTVSDCGDCDQPCTNAHGTTACAGGVCDPSCAGLWGECDGDPAIGCETDLAATQDCGGCDRLCSNQHVDVLACDGGLCTSSCVSGWGNCLLPVYPAADDGCETHIDVDSASCGGCDRLCSSFHASSLACAGGLCTSSCETGWGNCELPAYPLADDGCETRIAADTSDCGGCDRICSSAHVDTLSCAGGLCTSSCVVGFGNCELPAYPADDDGCETDLDGSPADCGGCDRACSSAHTSSLACTGGLCTPVCAGGWGDCSRPVYPAADDGCETYTDSTSSDCGGCDRACSAFHTASVSCAGGVCASSCEAGWANCEQPAYPAADDGCETHAATSTDDCGGCDRVCSADHVAALACAGGLCSSSCQPGWGNCSQPAYPGDDDGCETATDADTAHCGGCARACSTVHTSTLSCAGGVCDSSCANGWGNCSLPAFPAADDGCETDLNTPVDCGDCGRACSSLHTDSLACANGLCSSSCVSGWANCSRPAAPAADDGCETHADVDTAHCGGCNRSCSSSHTASVLCSGGLCSSSCEGGWANCGQPAYPAADDGCEIHTDVDTAHCGSCSRACSSLNATSLACALGLCTPVCLAGYANCSLPPAPAADDGCETYIDGSTAACGACTRPCSTAHVASLACSGGLCSSTCTSGWGNCVRPVAPAADDGCETDLTTSMQHCGGCDQPCSLPHASETCSGGSCIIVACEDPWKNCDTDQANGCETDSSTSIEHCLVCGNACVYAHAGAVCGPAGCEMSACHTDYWDLDGLDATGCEYHCVYQGSSDEPDPAYIDRDCDGIDGEIDRAVFVSALGDDGHDGSMNYPVRSISRGLQVAVADSKDYLLVSAGTFNEASTLSLANGKSIYGGYDPVSWQRSSGNVTRIVVSSSTAVSASGISSTTWLAQLEIEGANAAAGGSAYGVLAVSSSGLGLLDCTVEAGRGGDGSDGSSPSGSASDGGNGNPGQAGCEDSSWPCSSCDRPYGGSGGSSSCSRTGGTGGRPGKGSGDGSAGGSGVGGTAGGPGTPDGQGDWNTPSTYWGGNGADGANGTDGTAGAEGYGSGGYAPSHGANGTSGAHGNGGGGGGGGGGGDTSCDSYGGGGGGGGAGGCGGTRALGGTSAGGAFAVYLWNSNAAVQGCTLITAGGGAGGNGGTGQPGGTGGEGGHGVRTGAGNTYSSSGEQDDGSNGGRGGWGGDGGRGGHGGGGTGGASVCVLSGGSSSPSLSGNTYSPGSGGTGGSSAGHSGAAGRQQNVYSP